METVRIEVMDGVVIEVDPAVWDVRGIPLALKPANQPSKLQFDMNIVALGGHESKLEGFLNLEKARR